MFFDKIVFKGMLGKLKILIVVLAIFCPQFAFAADDGVSNEDIKSLYEMLKELNWNQSKVSQRQEIFNRVETVLNTLDEEEIKRLEDDYNAKKEKEQSVANRTLGAVTMAATGVGGMELARGLAEQRADKNAADSMSAYIATMRCTYADNKQVMVGTEPIELPGGNNQQLMQYRDEYITLANDLKERKTSLGVKPGIESEEIIDSASAGLYDDESTGITAGAYESLYRAQVLGSESDIEKLAQMTTESKNRVTGGAIALGAGVLIGVAGNLMINGNNGKLSEREQVVADLNNIMQQVIDSCNSEIKRLQENIPDRSEYVVPDIDGQPGLSYDEYVAKINGLEPIKNVSEITKIKDSEVCR